MEQYERIRRLVKVEGKSIRVAAESLGHSRKTIRKALVHASPPGYRRQVPAPRPAIDPVKPIIEAWLEEDRQRPRKQRHTGQRIFERLRGEYEFTGSGIGQRVVEGAVDGGYEIIEVQTCGCGDGGTAGVPPVWHRQVVLEK